MNSGEIIGDSPKRTLVVKVDRPELVLSEFRYGPGQHGPGNHVHREHSDSFWVLEGELTVELAGERVTLGAGGYVLVPPGVVHTFRNDGDEDSRFLNMHSPGCGFADHLRAMRDGRESEGFDQFDPPADGGLPASEAVVRQAPV